MLTNGRRIMIIVFIFLPREYLFLRRRVTIFFGFIYLTIRRYIVPPERPRFPMIHQSRTVESEVPELYRDLPRCERPRARMRSTSLSRWGLLLARNRAITSCDLRCVSLFHRAIHPERSIARPSGVLDTFLSFALRKFFPDVCVSDDGDRRLPERVCSSVSSRENHFPDLPRVTSTTAGEMRK